MGYTLTMPKARFFDDEGAALAGGKVYFYNAGTGTPKDTFSDSALSSANTNPVILDDYGEAVIWMTANEAYKIKVTDADDTQRFVIDNYKFVQDQTYATYAAVEAIVGPSDGDEAVVTGEGIAGLFVFDTSVATAANGGTILAADDGTTGRWIRRYG